jgi:DNA polymerase sigma
MAAPLGSGLRVEDPLDASNNAGSGCFGISGVQAVFKEQLETLIKAAESDFSSNVPLLMQLIMLGGQHKVFVV